MLLKLDELIDVYWTEYWMTPEQKMERVKQRLEKPLKELNRQIGRMDSDLEFLQRDIDRAAREQNRTKLTNCVRDAVRTKRKRRAMEKRRTTLDSFVGIVEDFQVSEKMQGSMQELLECTATLSIDEESIRATTAQFSMLRMSMGVASDEMREAVEASDDEDSEEDDEVARIVEEALQNSALALLDAMPVLGGSGKPPAPKKKELTLEEMERLASKK